MYPPSSNRRKIQRTWWNLPLLNKSLPLEMNKIGDLSCEAWKFAFRSHNQLVELRRREAEKVVFLSLPTLLQLVPGLETSKSGSAPDIYHRPIIHDKIVTINASTCTILLTLKKKSKKIWRQSTLTMKRNFTQAWRVLVAPQQPEDTTWREEPSTQCLSPRRRWAGVELG